MYRTVPSHAHTPRSHPFIPPSVPSAFTIRLLSVSLFSRTSSYVPVMLFYLSRAFTKVFLFQTDPFRLMTPPHGHCIILRASRFLLRSCGTTYFGLYLVLTIYLIPVGTTTSLIA